MENCENSMDVTDQSWVYFNFYNMKEPPFSITPDPEFLFFSQTHQNVIEKILYGIKIRAGFILLSGEVGTGKTTICRSIIDTLNTDGEIVYIINPSLSGKALISNILDDLGMQHPPEASKKDLINQLNNYLLNRDRHKPVIIIIDDAQTMPVETLEDLRLLSNLETDKEKMLQMLIVGQPEIEDLLSGAEMRQLKQRIFVNCRLEHLNPHEVEGYINRRLFIAGSNGQIQFSQGAKRKIVKASRGIPRLINKICDYALTASYVAEEFIIRKKHVKRALKELGDLDFKNKIFFRGVFGQTIIRTVSLLFAAAMSLTVILAVFFTPILEKPYSFLVDNVPRPITAQNLTMVNTKSPEGNQVSSGMLVDKNATVVDKALCHLFPAAKMDISPQTSLFNFEKKSNGRTWIPAYHPFVIQLGTFKTIAQVMKAVSNYTQKGLEIHWNPIDFGEKGRQYRIFTGHFESKAQALETKKDQRLENSLILFNPWTVLVGQYSDVKILSSVSSLLRENQYDSYVVKSADGNNWLLTGAFPTKQGAENMVKEIHRFCPSAQVAPR